MKEWPREGLSDASKETLCELWGKKPAATYDNWVVKYSEKCFGGEGYSLEKNGIIDFIKASSL